LNPIWNGTSSISSSSISTWQPTRRWLTWCIRWPGMWRRGDH